MKIIGVELRFGASGPAIGDTKYEAKLIPVELAYPHALTTIPCRPYLDGTIHTSLGDVGFTVQLPMEYVSTPDMPTYQMIQHAMQELKRRVEAL